MELPNRPEQRQSHLSTFNLFNMLAPELQGQIWRHALPEPTIHDLENPCHDSYALITHYCRNCKSEVQVVSSVLTVASLSSRCRCSPNSQGPIKMRGIILRFYSSTAVLRQVCRQAREIAQQRPLSHIRKDMANNTRTVGKIFCCDPCRDLVYSDAKLDFTLTPRSGSIILAMDDEDWPIGRHSRHNTMVERAYQILDEQKVRLLAIVSNRKQPSLEKRSVGVPESRKVDAVEGAFRVAEKLGRLHHSFMSHQRPLVAVPTIRIMKYDELQPLIKSQSIEGRHES